MPLMPTSIISASPIAPTGLVTIYDSTLQADAANFDVQNIPGGYKHLKIFLSGSTTHAAQTYDFLHMTFNNDTGSNYSSELVQSFGTTDTPSEALAQAYLILALFPGGTSPAGCFGITEANIPDYAGTQFHKAFEARSAARLDTTSGNTQLLRSGGVWFSTNAITQITFTPSSGNFKAGSRLTVYGMGGDVGSSSSSVTANDSNLIVAMEVFA